VTYHATATKSTQQMQMEVWLNSENNRAWRVD